MRVKITNENLGRQLIKIAQTEQLKDLTNAKALIIAEMMEKERLEGIEEGKKYAD